MATANTFPAPPGVTTAFTGVRAGATTPNFTLDPGLWVISVEFDDATQNLGGDQVTLVQVTAGFGLVANSTVLTITRSGYYNYVAGMGPSLSYNFQTTNGVRNVRATKVDVSTGPS